MRRLLLICALIVCAVIMVSAQQPNFWSPVNESTISKDLFANRFKPEAYKIFQLNDLSFRTEMQNAPSEKIQRVSRSSFIISIPDADGKIERFRVVEAPVMDPQLAAKYPGINSYAGEGIDNPFSTIRFDISPAGFHGMILSLNRPTIYIDPIDKAENYYVVVSRNELSNYKKTFQCLTTAGPNNSGAGTRTGGENLKNADDGKLRTYRLALCASGEFSQYWLDGTETSDAERKAKVLAAQNTEITRVNGIYERDFGVRVILVANNDAVIYLDPNTDPWNSHNLNTATQTTCDNVIGSANYDIGHLVHRASDNGNAGCIGCVCKAGSKGGGFTAYMNLSSDYFVVDYLTHEMGHQFGGNHTFTFQNEGTIAQVEPGSGSTIMGYAGITGSTDVQAHSDDYFHAISIQQVTDYIKSGTGGGACAVVINTGDATPTANAGADYVIPKSTPFILNGSGTDADASDVLTYCWEQNDALAGGTSTIPSATATSGPQFRSYLPNSTTSRIFPEINSVLSGTNSNKWEVLPSVARTLHFRFTVRDNHSGGGNNNSDDMIVTVSSTTGPFAVTSPNTSVAWSIGTSQTVTWSVNGTNGTPVNCANVNILLSTDGGQTFPITLAANTPNDGSQSITVPDNPSSTCRVKVEAVGNIFFDISNANFTIGVASACADPSNLRTTGVSSNSATLNWDAVSGANSYDVDYKQSSSSSWINAATGTTNTSVTLNNVLTASTSYDWRVRANCASASSNYSQSSFTTSASGGACPGPYDVGNNNSTSGAATIPLNTDILGAINPKNDNDYYKFIITTGGTISLTLSNLPANYQLSLLNSSGNQLALSQNNGTSSEAINNFTVAAGTFYARVFPKANASSSSCYTLRVQTGTATKTGPELLTQNPGISIFPNPVKDELKINISNINETIVINVFDIYGRKMISRQSAQSTTLNVNRLTPGIYFVTVSTKQGMILQQEKIMKE